ncbi:GyrI-like domain-containing protein [Flavobacteriaceae bacterium F08102]|nr:GyrI-like domain-containing protein [Flavobacteriaceae bacterium F08102]
MKKIKIPSFTLAGLKLEGKTINKNNQSKKDCGNLWQQFENNNTFSLIPNKLGPEIYAVYFDYEKDETTPFAYFIGCKVSEDTPLPNNLSTLVIPSQNYEKITAKGKMTGCITEAWKLIWKSSIPRTFGFDFEVYGEQSRDWNNAEIDIYISVKE